MTTDRLGRIAYTAAEWDTSGRPFFGTGRGQATPTPFLSPPRDSANADPRIVPIPTRPVICP